MRKDIHQNNKQSQSIELRKLNLNDIEGKFLTFSHCDIPPIRKQLHELALWYTTWTFPNFFSFFQVDTLCPIMKAKDCSWVEKVVQEREKIAVAFELKRKNFKSLLYKEQNSSLISLVAQTHILFANSLANTDSAFLHNFFLCVQKWLEIILIAWKIVLWKVLVRAIRE